MSDRVTTTIPAERLPEEIRAQLHARPLPGQPFRVTVEAIEETDAEKMGSLRARIARGLAEADRGELLDEDEVFGPLQARYPEA